MAKYYDDDDDDNEKQITKPDTLKITQDYSYDDRHVKTLNLIPVKQVFFKNGAENVNNEKAAQTQNENFYIHHHGSSGSTDEGGPRLRVPQKNEIKFIVNVTPNSKTITSFESTTTKTDTNYDDDDDDDVEIDGLGVHKAENYLSILKETDNLPKIVTPENIDSGIKTLTLILERLQKEKQAQSIAPQRPVSKFIFII